MAAVEMEISVLFGVAALLALAAALAGIVLGRHLWPATRRRDAAVLMTREIELARLTEERRALRSRATSAAAAFASNVAALCSASS